MGDDARSYARSAELFERARAVIAGGVNSNARMHERPVPTFFARGAGAYLYDVDGNQTIDYVLGIGPNILGHGPPAVVAVVGESLALGQRFGAQHESETTLAELVCACVPCAELVRFGLSGSEMVQAALREVR